MKGFIVFACAVVVVCAVAVRFAATHSAKCIKYAERDEFLYLMWVGGVFVFWGSLICLFWGVATLCRVVVQLVKRYM